MEALFAIFIEVAVAILHFVFELTLMLIPLMIAPVRFLVSKKYREKKLEQWRESKPKQFLDITLTAITTTLFMGVIIFWVSLFSPSDQQESEPTVTITTETKYHGSNTTSVVVEKMTLEEAKEKFQGFLNNIKKDK